MKKVSQRASERPSDRSFIEFIERPGRARDRRGAIARSRARATVPVRFDVHRPHQEYSVDRSRARASVRRACAVARIISARIVGDDAAGGDAVCMRGAGSGERIDGQEGDET